RDDVLVRAARGRARLDEEALDEVWVVAKQELDRDLAAELGVAAEKHLAHPTARELADQLEPADRVVAREIERLRGVAAESPPLRARIRLGKHELRRGLHGGLGG